SGRDHQPKMEKFYEDVLPAHSDFNFRRCGVCTDDMTFSDISFDDVATSQPATREKEEKQKHDRRAGQGQMPCIPASGRSMQHSMC
ncbi:hypothetical protein LSAT2_017150, partial [Lamellibrachia satsuma]